MANIHEKVSAEIENIEKLLAELSVVKDPMTLSALELAGCGALLHNFYNCIENILKQVCVFEQLTLPTGSFWHRDLLEVAVTAEIISSSTKEILGPYLAYRHFFVHGYAMDLKADRMAPLLQNCFGVFSTFCKDLSRHGFLNV